MGPGISKWGRAPRSDAVGLRLLPTRTCEEELELLLAPGTVTGFKGVQEVKSGYYQAKLRNGRSFMSLPSSRSVLVAAWFYAKAFKARRADGVESVELKESVSKVRARSLPTRRCLLLTNPCPIP